VLAHDEAFVKENLPESPGVVLDIGGGHSNFKPIRQAVLDRGGAYVSVDMNGTAMITHDMRKPLDHPPVKAVICLSTLEHCDEVWLVAQNIERVLSPGGVLLVSAPFQWRVHNYPSDYWRFTPDGFRALFRGIEFESIKTQPEVNLATHNGGKVMLYGKGRKR
jgi:hypothetical protein